jgi:putative ATP-dependent endonuclease of OLD family
LQITNVRIRNFRSIKDLSLQLEPTTVFIGANNAGKSAIVDAVRIALTRRWGRRGTGFTEHDIYASAPGLDPKTLDPVVIELQFEERIGESWPDDLIADLNEVVVINNAGRNMVWLRVTCGWNETEAAFTPNWQFLDAAGLALSGGAQRANNFNSFFKYPHFFWLSALRDAEEEFGARAALWTTLLRAIKIPKVVEDEVRQALDAIDAKMLAADPKFAEIAASIGQSTTIAPGDTPGDARLRMLPIDMWDMISRTSVMLQMEQIRPWLPLLQQGQGLKSLAVVYLFQAAMQQRLADESLIGAEPILGIEEPETHLHPQAARTLWGRLSVLSGQKLVTSHSPPFVQHVPIHAIRMVHLAEQTAVASVPRTISSSLPWTARVEQAFATPGALRKAANNTVEAAATVTPTVAERLEKCWGGETDEAARIAEVRELRHRARELVSARDEEDLAIAGRRVRGEVFFARRWALVEGPCEYLLLHAIAEALGWPLDQHGVAVIDFQNNGNPGIYASLATAFGLEWRMIVDGDDGGDRCIGQLIARGFDDGELTAPRVAQLTKPNTLEMQLVADGHGPLLKDILKQHGDDKADSYDDPTLLARLKNAKIAYMTTLAQRVGADAALADTMPAPFAALVKDWRGS